MEYTYQGLKDFARGILNGDHSVEVIQREFEQFVSAGDLIQEEISDQYKVAELKRKVGWVRDSKKAGLVKAYYEALLSYFNVVKKDGGVYIFSGKWIDHLRKKVMDQTQEGIDEALAARVVAAKAREKALTNPETREEFTTFIRVKGVKALSSEQLERYESFVADDTLEKFQSQKKKNATLRQVTLDGVEMSLQKTVHTQKGHDLWVVRLSDRVDKEVYRDLVTKAKQLGGYYSSYSRGGAIPGYQFKTEEAANKFMQLKEGDVSREEELEAKYANKVDKRVVKLLVLADKWEAKGQEKLSQDRKTNTARRARMAAGVEADAENLIWFAKVLRNIAKGIGDGEIKYLVNLDSAAQLSTLNTVWNAAYWRRLQGTNYQYGQKPPKNIVEDIEFVGFPYPSIHRDRLDSILGKTVRQKGYKLLSNKIGKQKLKKLKREEHQVEFYQNGVEWVRKLLRADFNEYDKSYLKESVGKYDRLQRMGLTNKATLKTALREYAKYSDISALSPEQEQEKKIKALERKFVGRKIDGFFPTPPQLVDLMLEMVVINEGDTILEPSAGLGHIADAIASEYPENELFVGEINGNLREALEEKGHQVACHDFLECKERTYDVIIMNPPFERDQDIKHVLHAYELLNPGGRLVAIMANNKQGERGMKKAFKTFLEETDAFVEKNPDGAFKSAFRPTGVNTITVSITKEGDKAEVAAVTELASVVEEKGESKIRLEITKQLWQIPKKDFVEGFGKIYNGYKFFDGEMVSFQPNWSLANKWDMHKRIVKDAILMNAEVPTIVLADYPELMKKENEISLETPIYQLTYEELIRQIFEEGRELEFDANGRRVRKGNVQETIKFFKEKFSEQELKLEGYFDGIKQDIRKVHKSRIVWAIINKKEVPHSIINLDYDYQQLVKFVNDREKEFDLIKINVDIFPAPKRGGKYNKTEWLEIERTLYSIAVGDLDESRNPAKEVRILVQLLMLYDAYFKLVVKPFIRKGISDFHINQKVFSNSSYANNLLRGYFFKEKFKSKEERTLENLQEAYVDAIRKVVDYANEILEFVNDSTLWESNTIEDFDKAIKKYDGKFPLAVNLMAEFFEGKFFGKKTTPYWITKKRIDPAIARKMGYGDRWDVDKVIREYLENKLTLEDLNAAIAQEIKADIKDRVESYKRFKELLQSPTEVLIKYLIEKGWKCTRTNINRAFSNENVKAYVDEEYINITNNGRKIPYRTRNRGKVIYMSDDDACESIKNALASEYHRHHNTDASQIEKDLEEVWKSDRHPSYHMQAASYDSKVIMSLEDVNNRYFVKSMDGQRKADTSVVEPFVSNQPIPLKAALKILAQKIIDNKSVDLKTIVDAKRNEDARIENMGYLSSLQMAKLGEIIYPQLITLGVENTAIDHLLKKDLGDQLISTADEIFYPRTSAKDLAEGINKIMPKDIKDRVELRLREAEKNKAFKDSENRKKGAIKEKRAYDVIKFQNLIDIEDDPIFAQKIITKDKVFPKIDIEAEKANGVSAGAAFWKNEIRASINSRPFDSADARKAFVKGLEILQVALVPAKTVLEVRATVESFVSEKIAQSYIGDLSNLAGFRTTRMRYAGSYLTSKKLAAIFGKRFMNTVKIHSDAARRKVSLAVMYEPFTFEQQEGKRLEKIAQKERCLTSLQADLKTKKANKGADTSRDEQRIEIYTEQIKKLKSGDIDGFLREYEKERPANWSWSQPKTKEQAKNKVKVRINTKEPLSHIRRKGGVLLPWITATNIDNVFSEKIGFFSIEYGNSLPDKERELHANRFYQSIVDLEELTGLNIKKLNAYGKLGIGFATRGSAGHAASYNSGYRIINLTRRNGDGSLAHEYGHYMDDIIAKVAGKKRKVNGALGHFASQSGAKDEGVNDAINAIMRRVYQGESTIDATFYAQDEYRYRIGEHENVEAAIAYVKSKVRYYENGAYQKKLFGFVAQKFGLPSITVTLPIKGSRYYANCEAMGSKYWTEPVELFARVWESYIWLKMEKTGIFNNYLQSNPYTKFIGMGIGPPFPEGQEAEDFYVLTDKLVEAMKVNLEMASSTGFSGERVDTVEVIAVPEKKKEEKPTLFVPPVAAPKKAIDKAKKIKIAKAKAAARVRLLKLRARVA